MNGRNRISILIAIMIVSGATLATIITIRDHNIILSQFQDFINDPFTWDDVFDNNGFLSLYVIGNTIENETEEISSVTFAVLQPEIFHLVLVINQIKFKIFGRDIEAEILDFPISIDLKDINNTRDLISTFELPEGKYSAVHLYYEQEIIAETSQGNKTFQIQGSGFIPIPIYQSSENQTQTNIEIKEDMGTNLMLSFNMQIKWQQMLIVSRINGYKTF